MNTPMTPPIRLDAISKCYRIFQNPQDRFKQALLDRFQGVLGRKSASPLYREHWALRDVSFELQPGEAVGVLGRNGAGKSTLLQIIAGTLEPSAGIVQTTGRITALLELGSGFNPEFTGRENVFLNAQILGLSREDALARFDDIAAFADIGDFIDQPVKTYSSGMMMRLAFAVQTAVEPKVLIVDEALSVGDMFFQAKCMARISRLVDSGVALLFVSHDISTVRQLCQRAVLLDGGIVRSMGAAATVSDQYVKLQLEDRNQSARIAAGNVSTSSDTVVNIETEGLRAGTEPDYSAMQDMAFGQEAFQKRAQHHRVSNDHAEIVNVQMLRKDDHSADFDFDDEATIRVFVRFAKDLSNLNLSIKIRTLQGTDVAFFDTRLQGEMSRHYQTGTNYLFEWAIKLPLLHGNYALAAGLAHPPEELGADWIFVDIVPHAYEFRMAPRKNGMIDGFVSLPTSLTIKKVAPKMV
ncbi:MAG: ABC transporter ATP-binding protein [Dechloromonas sp.]|uniref:ABC transporter ATP-binding protein n=1 Tax=Dechloromonas sp. TaxID=1917218 RepID=UPI0027F96032|nr:ABC transporter ATP-binding protein [Dechloromonas sp.]MBT9519352.1 ABC transporter ATP-binding protein [Dechloromonas sp.]